MSTPSIEISSDSSSTSQNQTGLDNCELGEVIYATDSIRFLSVATSCHSQTSASDAQLFDSTAISSPEKQDDFKPKVKAGRTRAAVTRCLEPSCKFVCGRIPQLRTHLEDIHGIPQERKMFAFSNEADFRVWLSELEREARCTYMRRRGWQLNKNGSFTGCFYCHRGGAYTSMATKKLSKMQGSCKTGIECTSSLKVQMRSSCGKRKRSNNDDFSDINHIEVEAYLQHYGHNLDISHTRINKVEKANIAKRLSDGISRNKILDEIRGTLDTTTQPHRVHLLSLQDIYNIEKKEGISAKKAKSNTEAGTTVQAWIEKMQSSEDNPVLLIKYQQEKATDVCSCLSMDDFILILQTPLQSMMLQKHGPHQSICIDITQGEGNSVITKDASFYLIILQIILPSATGMEVFPVAWFVSNRKDKAVIEIFLMKIKNNLSDLTLTPSHLFLPTPSITGGVDWFNLWSDVFGSGPRKLLCGWHILAEWRQQAKKINRSQPLEGTRVLTNLTTVLHETNPESFVQLTKGFVDDLAKSDGTLGHLNHFERYYTSQPEAWSRAYRPDPVQKIECCFEEFHHRVSRHIYHEGFKKKQLDVLVKTLLKNSRDRALVKLRQSYRYNSDAAVKRMTNSQHLKSASLPLEFVTGQKDSHTWTVMSVIDSVRAVETPIQAGDPLVIKEVAVEYFVKCTDVDGCPARLKCAYRCEPCGICSHHFVCTCQTEQANNVLAKGDVQVLCEHCHLVCQYLKKNGHKIESLFAAPVSEEVNSSEKSLSRGDDIKNDLSNTVDNSSSLMVVVETDELQNSGKGQNFLFTSGQLIEANLTATDM